jgi:L-threonylcarbamoyladenylate synthase
MRRMPILLPTAEHIAFAAAALRRGELVGMPTETVYGLAALASDPVAVARTFAAKRRPSDNPLIVHLASAADLPQVARTVPPAARALAAAFWPGPLTLVLPRQPHVLAAITAGGDTVAVRVPDHPVALALLRAVGVPLTAPSANPFMRLSPTAAADIDADLQAQLACTLDGGPCRVGLESTVVDCAGPGPVRVLRPGGVPRIALAAVLGSDVPLADVATAAAAGPRPAPGMYARHYAPRTPLRLAEALGADDAGLCFGPPANPRQVAMPADPESYGASLYRVLHALDALGARELVVQQPPREPAWEAVADRLRKAAAAG